MFEGKQCRVPASEGHREKAFGVTDHWCTNAGRSALPQVLQLVGIGDQSRQAANVIKNRLVAVSGRRLIITFGPESEDSIIAALR